MADQKPFAGLSQDDTLFMMLLKLAEIADKLPRSDANDRMVITGVEMGTVAVTATNSAYGALSRPGDAIPLHTANIGAQHIYSNIVVT